MDGAAEQDGLTGDVILTATAHLAHAPCRSLLRSLPRPMRSAMAAIPYRASVEILIAVAASCLAWRHPFAPRCLYASDALWSVAQRYHQQRYAKISVCTMSILALLRSTKRNPPQYLASDFSSALLRVLATYAYLV